MSDDYGNDFITITDDEGNRFELEHLDTIETNGNIYMAFLPADMSEDDEDYGLIILKVITENGEELLSSIDDDEEQEAVYVEFLERFTAESEV